MTQIAAIRTNKWTEEEERLLASLRPVFGEDLVVVFHNRPEGLTPPVEVVDITDDWVQGAGLRAVGDWGWRCGDYFYYRLRAAKPDYDFYWLIEPDVFFDCDPAAFFARFDGVKADLLGLEIAPAPRAVRYARRMNDIPAYSAIFALTRASGGVLDYLHGARAATAQDNVRDMGYANDEVFVFSHTVAHADFTTDGLEKHAGDLIASAHFTSNPDMLAGVSQKLRPAIRGKVIHPMTGPDAFKRAVGARLSSRIGFLGKIRGEIATLTEQELDEIADIARDRMRAHMDTVKQGAVQDVPGITEQTEK